MRDNAGVLVKQPKEICMSQLRQRLQREEGFTLIELLVVIVIIGILLAIAVPSYLGFRDRANRSAAQSNLRQAIPSAEGYFSDNQTYVGLAVGPVAGANNDLKDYDTGLSSDVAVGPAAQQTATGYCIQATHGGFDYKFAGPGGTIVAGTC
jgi:type IV pilus assembly protein PilA